MKEFELYKKVKPAYAGDSGTDPAISMVFSTAAYRFGHTLIPDGFFLMDQDNIPNGPFITMDDMFNQPDTYRKVGNQQMMRAFATQNCQGYDHKLSPEIRDNFFRKLHNGMPHDLASRNIMRGREHGLPPYNKWRQLCQLPEARDFDDLDMSTERISSLKSVYADVNDIDAFVGFISEKRTGLVGPTLACLIGQQFKRLKHGDRFFYLNTQENPNPFSRRQLKQLNRVRLSKVICDNHKVDTMPFNVFNSRSDQTHCATISGLNLYDFV